jgi:hypothetical protein
MRTVLVAGATLAALAFAGPASATEPWSDPDPPGPPSRFAVTDQLGFRGAAEYRANALLIRPLDLSSTTERNRGELEHRLRLDGEIDWQDKIRIATSFDVLDGVLWGDNGSLGEAPEPTTGAKVSTRNANIAAACVELRPGAPPTEASSYHYGLCPTNPITPRRLYGDIVTPIGLFRIGRQAFTEGASIAVNDGDGRKNRFGVSGTGNSADRILFATKPLEAFKPPDKRDKTETRGAFLILAYDHLVTGDPLRFKDDLRSWITAVRWVEPEHRYGSDAELRLYHAYRWSTGTDTGISAFGGRAMSRFGESLGVGAEASVITGSTREIADAVRVITNDPPVSQDVRQFGARAVVRWDEPLYTLYFETDYASGDSDPQVRTPLTQFKFAEDANVGLLLFEHVLAYQTARAAAAGNALLRDLGAPTYPLDSVSTRGSFTNAFAIFPQVDVHPVPSVLLRGGVLMAWAPSKVVDPVASLQNKDGLTIDDDLVNFAGGRPSRYYGTELDGRVQWRFMDHFAADLEGAVLFPGSALEDANGDAANSFLVQGRGTFFF